MYVKGITTTQAEDAAAKVGVELYNMRPERKGIAFVLRPKYQSTTFRAINKHRGAHRRKWAVCWHGHRDFMRELFKVNPDAVISSVLATYKGEDDFEHKFEDTGYTNIGSQMYPVYARQGCDCEGAL